MNVNILLITYIPILYYVLNNIIYFMFFIGIMIKNTYDYDVIIYDLF